VQNYSTRWLLDVLEKRAVLSSDTRRDIEVKIPQQKARLSKQKATDVHPGEVLSSLNLTDAKDRPLDEEYLAQIVAEETGLVYRKIDPLDLDMTLITQTLPRPFAVRHVVLPLSLEDDVLTVAVENPFDPEIIENLQRIHSGAIQTVIASKREIIKAIGEVYGFRQSVESAAKETQKEWLSDFEQLVTLRNVGELEASSDQHIVNAVDLLFRYAFDQRASDIHIEPRRETSHVRLRIDGVLHNTHTIPRRVHPAIAARIKTMSRMDIAEKRKPQDGRIKTMLADNKSVELRVSTLPTAFGEKIVIRIFDPEIFDQDLPALGFAGQDLQTLEKWLTAPHGLILVTGPTGSGKTTTLYTALNRLAREEVNITTIEDPIEMVVERFNQVAVQPKIDITFANALRTILRQDPDIIMVGEIRDSETAQMAIQAALTGHLVLSTLHTNDSVGAVTRLLDLDTPPFLVSSTLLGVLAQRLVRKVCEQCKVSRRLTFEELAVLGATNAESFASTVRGLGCSGCRNTGFLGRIGIFELFDITLPIASLIGQRTEEEALRKHRGPSLRESALQRLADGFTTFEEVVRVLGR
jgi:general secretion pathway protein E